MNGLADPGSPPSASADRTTHRPRVIEMIGTDRGRLVLHLGSDLHTLIAEPHGVLRTATTGHPIDAGSGTVTAGEDTWSIDIRDGQTRLSMTALIDEGDVDAAAATGADCHARFERTLHLISTGALPAPFRCAYFVEQMQHYRALVAAALANTD